MTVYYTLGISYMSVVLGLGLWPHGLSVVHFGMSNGTILVLFSSYLDSDIGET